MKYKVLVVPDLHGKTLWKEKADPSRYDKIVFIGDYCDDFFVEDEDIINNLRDIIQFRKDNPDKVVLLLGNHDIQYYYGDHGVLYRCSGFRRSYEATMKHIFAADRDLFQVAYKLGDHLFTHAGISEQWWESASAYIDRHAELIGSTDKVKDIDKILNHIHQDSKDQYILHTVGYLRGGSGWGGPTWADLRETSGGIAPPGIHQVVGHSKINTVSETNVFAGETKEDRSITYVDCLDTRKDVFYEKEIEANDI